MAESTSVEDTLIQIGLSYLPDIFVESTEQDLSIQKKVFTRWCNEKLKRSDDVVIELPGFLDVSKLVSLVEALSGKTIDNINYRPRALFDKLQNIDIAISFLIEEEHLNINIDGDNIINGDVNLTLDFVWTLICHYQLHDDEIRNAGIVFDRLLTKFEDMIFPVDDGTHPPLTNFTTDWIDGRLLAILVNWASPDEYFMTGDTPLEIATHAMKQANDILHIPMILLPEEIVNPHIDSYSVITYLSQFEVMSGNQYLVASPVLDYFSESEQEYYDAYSHSSTSSSNEDERDCNAAAIPPLVLITPDGNSTFSSLPNIPTSTDALLVPFHIPKSRSVPESLTDCTAPYSMNSRPHGVALVVVNESHNASQFKADIKESQIFAKVFEHLQYSVQCYSYKGGSQLSKLTSEISAFSQTLNDSFMCYISPTEDNYNEVGQLIEKVQECSSLTGKPKIFIINCSYQQITIGPDTLVIWTTQREVLNVQNYFPTAFRDVFFDKSTKADLLTMTNEVTAITRAMPGTQCCVVDHKLTKKVNFYEVPPDYKHSVKIRWSQVTLTGLPESGRSSFVKRLLNESLPISSANPVTYPPEVTSLCLVACEHSHHRWRKSNYTSLKPMTFPDEESVLPVQHWIRVLDSGGHPAFLELATVLLRSSSVNIFTQQLHDVYNNTLMHNCSIKDFADGSLNILKDLGQLLSSSDLPELDSSGASGRNPSILVLGTFADICRDTSVLTGEIFELMKDFENVKLIRRKRKELIFPINTISEDSETVSLVRNYVCKSFVEKEVPFGWFLLQLELSHLQKIRNIVSIDKCVEIGVSIKVERSDVLEALDYYHDLTIFHYFPDILPNIVFLHPQPLLDVLLELINSTNAELMINGTFKKSLLQDVSFTSLFTADDFLKLMDHLSIIITWQEAIDKHLFLSFLPTSVEYQNLDYDPSNANPLVLTWDMKIIPRGFYARVVVNLLSRQISPTFRFSRKSQQYCNVTSFNCPELGGMLTLVNTLYWLEIHYSGPPYEYVNVKKLILEVVSSVAKKIPQYKEGFASKPQEGFHCVVHQTPNHICCLAEDNITLTCCSNGYETGTVTDSQRVWFDISSKDYSSSLEKALSEGSIKIKWTNFVFCGAPGTGKSTVLDLLLNNPPDVPQADSSMRDLLVTDISVKPDDTWEKMNIGFIRKFICRNLKPGNTPQISDDEEGDNLSGHSYDSPQSHRRQNPRSNFLFNPLSKRKINQSTPFDSKGQSLHFTDDPDISFTSMRFGPKNKIRPEEDHVERRVMSLEIPQSRTTKSKFRSKSEQAIVGKSIERKLSLTEIPYMELQEDSSDILFIPSPDLLEKYEYPVEEYPVEEYPVEEHTDDRSFSKPIYECHLIKAIDSGGHAAFLDIAPALISYNSANVLTLLLSKKLTERVAFAYSIDGQTFFEPVECQKTNLQYLEESFRSLATVDPYRPNCIRASKFDQKPHFIIVGTAFEKKSKSKESLSDKNKLLISKLSPYMNQIVKNQEPNDVILPITALSRRDRDLDMAARLRKLISRYYLEAEIPARWFLFQLELNRIWKRDRQSIISMKKCVDVGRKLKMGSRDVEAALTYCHDLTVLLYFSKILPKVVFLHPQPLIDKLSELISISFPAVVKHLGDRLPGGAYHSMKIKGVFNKDILTLCFNKGFDDMFTVDDFLKLMSDLQIIASLPNNEYFFPSALCIVSESETSILRKSFDELQMEVAPLLLTWGMKPLPKRLLSSLVINLLHRQVAPRFIFLDVTQYRNTFQLICLSGGAMLIIDSVHWLEICYSGPSKECHSIQNAIYSELEEVSNKLGYSPLNSSPIKCFHCVIHNTTDHICFPSENKKVVTCARDGMSCTPIKLDQLPWLKDQDYNIRPTLKDLNLVLHEMSSQWRELGYCLNLQRSEMQELMFTSLPDSVKLMQVLKSWMDTPTAHVTWRTIIDIVSGPVLDNKFLCQEIKHFINSNDLTDSPRLLTNQPLLVPQIQDRINTPTGPTSIGPNSPSPLTDRDLRKFGLHFKEEDLLCLANYLNILDMTEYFNKMEKVKVKAYRLLKKWRDESEDPTREELIDVLEFLDLVKVAESLRSDK